VFASARKSDEDCEGHDEEEWPCRKLTVITAGMNSCRKKAFDFHLLSIKSLHARFQWMNSWQD
jgi:hypothetical protein